MTIRKIARMGHDVLKQVCTPVADPTSPEIARLAADLIETCEDIGGNGIAAPQVYEPVRMFVFRVRRAVMPDGAKMAEIPWTVVINPKITFLSEETKPYWERCLSLPGLYGQAIRRTHIRMDATGLDGEPYSWTTQYFLARLLQHEFDHLDGVLYPMRMADISTLGFVTELGPAPYPPLPFDVEDFVDPVR
ncbi:MAG: peptide deformylase [Alphaproteobacteria bacterium]|nr:peptide deformylase [Alphaproteobacteria bacterium]